MARISMGYPDMNAELAMIRGRETSSPLDSVRPAVTLSELRSMILTVREVYVSPAVEQYVVDIVHATRRDADLRLGASPRATLQLIRAAKARAALDGRDFVLPDDIDALAVSVLSHRLIAAGRIASSASAMSGSSVPDIVARIVAATPVPLAAR
jgi:MoxR-like ATPase